MNHSQVGQELSLVPRLSTLHPIHVACGVKGLETRLVTCISVVQAFASYQLDLQPDDSESDDIVTLNDQQIFSEAV